MKRAAIVGVVGAWLLLFAGESATTSASTMASSNASWGRGIEAVLPANAATGAKQYVYINSVSCASAGNCSAVGLYQDESGAQQGLLLTKTAGTWATGVEAVLPADAATNPYVWLYTISCASAGNCSAVGSYDDGSHNGEGLMVTETDGVWGTGVEAALPANAATGANHGASVWSVSCAAAGNCSAVGGYVDSSNNSQALLLTETAGSWATGVEANLPANATATSQSASLNSVSCASPGNCTAVGGYLDTSGDSQALLLDETAGSWATGVEAALPANAVATNESQTGLTVLLYSVSCASAGNCSAVGSYCAVGNCNTLGNGSGSSGEEGLLLTETAGSWATGVEADLPANAATTSPLLYLNSVSCASAGNCSAAGSYFDGSEHNHLLLLTETAGSWATGVEAALPANAATGAAQAELGTASTSCSSPGNCTVAGSYSVGSDPPNTHGLLLTETAGVWATGVEPDLPANAVASNHYQYDDVQSISCPSAQTCTAVGFYDDSSGSGQGLLLASSPLPGVVPNLKGKTVAAAKRSIRSHGWSVGKIRHVRSRRIKKNHVISQKPQPGKLLKRGAKVSLVVSKGRRR